MQALILESPNQPDSLKLIDCPLPEPKTGQARVKINSVGLNRGDLLFIQNRYFIKPQRNSRIGFEAAGYVDALGPSYSNTKRNLKVGDRVALCPMTFDVHTQGCMAEYGVYDESSLIASPNGIDDELCGAIWMAYLTAWGGMVDAGKLTKGEYAVITAASSSVGIAAIQIANMLESVSIATTTSEDKAATLKTLGAAHVITQNQANLEDSIKHYVDSINTATNNLGSHLVFDAVAGPISHALVKASKREGRIIFHGLLDRRPMDIHAGVLMKRLLTLKGYTLDQTLQDPIQKQSAIEAILRGLETKQLQPVIAEKFKLQQYPQAFRLLASNSQIGKIVLTP